MENVCSLEAGRADSASGRATFGFFGFIPKAVSYRDERFLSATLETRSQITRSVPSGVCFRATAGITLPKSVLSSESLPAHCCCKACIENQADER